MSPFERSAQSGAASILRAWERYRREFREITREAARRFVARDWRGGQRDAALRLELYRRVLQGVVGELRALLVEVDGAAVWVSMKAIYSEAISQLGDAELAETFFNSVTRHVLDTIGIDPRIEFVDLDIRRTRYGPGRTVTRTYARASTTDALIRDVLRDDRFGAPYRNVARDVGLVAREVDAQWQRSGNTDPIESLELIEAVFYRGTGAYLVGRIRGQDTAMPLVMVLIHTSSGIEVDAVLLAEREVSIVFSFTRSYFHVDVDRPSDAVRFLNALMPRKPVAELYMSLGHPKHGKTELYRDLLGHLARSMDRFDYAPGDTGMVMIVFTLPSFDYVFKVIRDKFAYPKTSTREQVIDRYQLVFRHDRAGRLIEAQEFEDLAIETWRFAPELLEELSTAAASSVTIRDDEAVIHHVYAERRVQPLNLFLREAEEEAAARAINDYGQAIRDLARSNIFPGDLLLKNFGVTRHGRVTFYDYDELSLVTECEFREMPTARNADEELAAEPWFYVGPDDVFPEEFIHFLGLSRSRRRIFIESHAEVLTARFWRDLQARHRAGEVLDVFPYPPSKRLEATGGVGTPDPTAEPPAE